MKSFRVFYFCLKNMSEFLQLAPMQAMTDIFFMNTYHELFGGFSEMMTPYLLASNKSPIKLQTLKKQFDGIHPDIKLVPQLLSNDTNGFLHYSDGLHTLGYEKVNWNLGCPYPFVTKKMRGSGLLPFPEKIDAILNALDTRLKLKLSVKVRLGQHSDQEIFQLVDIFNNHRISEIIIHPRTASQKYDGTPKIKVFEQIYNLLHPPVIYNGNIVHLSDYINFKTMFPQIKGYMIGRGAFINPFITLQIAGKIFTANEKKQQYMEFYYRQHEHFKQKTVNDKGFLARMKELWAYFSQSFENGNKYFESLKTINNLTLFEHEVQQIFSNGKLKI